MVIYWCLIFLRNEDVSKVEIRLFEKSEDAKLPEFTICFMNPFIGDRLTEQNSNLTTINYLKYLKGEIPDNGKYSNINFDYVTMEFEKYIEEVFFSFRDGSTTMKEPCNNIQKCPFVTFRNSINGFWTDGTGFMKCFGIQIKQMYYMKVQAMTLTFNSSIMSQIEKYQEPFVNFNYPYQTLLMDEGDAIWSEDNNLSWLKIKTVEVLKQRNKSNQPCIPLEVNFDEIVLEDHIGKVGCRAPYQKSADNVPLCDTMKKMQNSIFEKVKVAKNHSLPCETMASVVYKNDKLHSNISDNLNSSVAIIVNYSDKLKVITQSQAVDLQALIGYIGGYIGLFLGNIYNILSSLSSIYSDIL